MFQMANICKASIRCWAIMRKLTTVMFPNINRTENHIYNNLFNQTQMKKQESQQKINRGRWTRIQHKKFMQALQKHGRNWIQIQRKVKTRSLLQVRSHAQKIFLSMTEEDIDAIIRYEDQKIIQNQQRLKKNKKISSKIKSIPTETTIQKLPKNHNENDNQIFIQQSNAKNQANKDKDQNPIEVQKIKQKIICSKQYKNKNENPQMHIQQPKPKNVSNSPSNLNKIQSNFMEAHNENSENQQIEPALSPLNSFQNYYTFVWIPQIYYAYRNGYEGYQ